MAIILGIESSCDETGVAIYNTNTEQILANQLHSQVELHNIYGGVVPELASRDHIKRISKLTQLAFMEANINTEQIDAIAYTQGPGLSGALLIGAGFANGLAFSLNKPIIPIHHLEAHILSPFLSDEKPPLPFIALLVSGGHTQIIAVYDIGKYEILADTLDDAAGEAFDKTAKMLDLPYPGGKFIAELAKNGKPIYKLPRPMLNTKELNMSFSGLKTAVLHLINTLKIEYNTNILADEIKCNIASSIEEAITDVLVHKVHSAIMHTNINILLVSGGVSANLRLRHKLNNLQNHTLNNKAQEKINIYYPPLQYCTDNAAMIALTGAFKYVNKSYDYSFDVKPRYHLA